MSRHRCLCRVCACPRLASGHQVCAPCRRMEHEGRPYGNGGLRVEQCACGSRIVAHDDDESIMRAVQIHNGSAQHGHWAAIQEQLLWGAAPRLGDSFRGHEER